MCFVKAPRPNLNSPTTPAQKSPDAPQLPQDDPRNMSAARRRLRIDLTQPVSGAGNAGLKIPV